MWPNLILRKISALFMLESSKVELNLQMVSLLHFLEFVSVKDEINKYKYSYHFQAKNHRLIFRYDVAPHHKDISSFPHHKHLGSGEVIAAAAPNLKEVLQEIETILAGTLESC